MGGSEIAGMEFVDGLDDRGAQGSKVSGCKE